MKLVSSVSRLERGRRRRARRTLIWSADELKLSRPLAEGEFLATDLCMVVPERVPGDPEEGSDKPPPAEVMQSRERATRDATDLGNVYDGAGVLIERVWDSVSCVVAGGHTVTYFYTCPLDSPAYLLDGTGQRAGGPPVQRWE